MALFTPEQTPSTRGGLQTSRLIPHASYFIPHSSLLIPHMPTIALDCQVILDGTGYFIEPQSYVMDRPRVRKADYTRQAASGSAGVGERYVDFGPGKREWTFTVVAYQAIRRYDGAFVSSTGQQYRDALHSSYQKVNSTLQFTDPLGSVWTVRFDNLAETIIDVRQQADNESLQYLCTVNLVEA